MASDAPPRVMPAPPPAPFYPFRTLPGRLLLLSGVSLIVLWLISQVVPLPPLIEAMEKLLAIGFAYSASCAERALQEQPRLAASG